MEILRYMFITDADLEKCERLRARGLVLPSLAFAIKPRFCPDGSAEFKLSMVVPAVAWIGLAITAAVFWIAAYRFGGSPSQYGFVFGVVICGFLAIAGFTWRRWRSVRVWADGRTQINEPRFFGRRVIAGQPGEARLLIGMSYGRSDRIKKHHRLKTVPGTDLSRFMLNDGKPIYRSTPCLVIVVKNNAFTLAREDEKGIEVLIKLLTEDYSLQLELSPVVYRYQGFIF